MLSVRAEGRSMQARQGATPSLRLKIAVEGTGGGSENRARVSGSGLRSFRPVSAS